jgi:hypothetical protein
MSKIFYKFRSENTYSTIDFDGPSMGVFDVKREIAERRKMKGDFDLGVYRADTNEGEFEMSCIQAGLRAVCCEAWIWYLYMRARTWCK